MNFLVTAGPTREYIDPIRFISNASSGRQGLSIAAAAKNAGHNVILISGPVTAAVPKGVPFTMVISAKEMLGGVLRYLNWADVLVMNAAVSDWIPVKKSGRKIKKTGRGITIKLAPAVDILARIAALRRKKKTRKGLLVVGFSADTDSRVKHAKEKLKAKDLDIIVVNPAETFGAPAVTAVIIDRYGTVMTLPLMTKTRFAARLVKLICLHRKQYRE